MGTITGTMSQLEQRTIKILFGTKLGTKLSTQDMDLESKDTILGKGTKIGTLSM